MKLQRYTECVKPGRDGCVNTEGAEHADAGFMHWCPACKGMHMIAVDRPFKNAAGKEVRWEFDGNLESPTFAPSVKITTGPRPTVPEGRPDAGRIDICHYHIRKGRIEFCNDCTHELSGQKVPLPDIPARCL